MVRIPGLKIGFQKTWWLIAEHPLHQATAHHTHLSAMRSGGRCISGHRTIGFCDNKKSSFRHSGSLQEDGNRHCSFCGNIMSMLSRVKPNSLSSSLATLCDGDPCGSPFASAINTPGLVFLDHLTIFAPIFVLWIIGFFIFNLYGKPTVAYQRICR